MSVPLAAEYLGQAAAEDVAAALREESLSRAELYQQQEQEQQQQQQGQQQQQSQQEKPHKHKKQKHKHRRRSKSASRDSPEEEEDGGGGKAKKKHKKHKKKKKKKRDGEDEDEEGGEKQGEGFLPRLGVRALVSRLVRNGDYWVYEKDMLSKRKPMLSIIPGAQAFPRYVFRNQDGHDPGERAWRKEKIINEIVRTS